MDSRITLHEYSQHEAAYVLDILSSSNQGISSNEAKRRLKKFGSNDLSQKKNHAIIFEFLNNFKSPLVIVLLFAALISFFFDEHVNGTIIAIIITLSATLNFFQEHRANKAAEKLLNHIATTATVIREANKSEVKTTELVPGDLIFLSSGDLIPADVRLIEAKDFFVNQSSLTGESFPVEKTASAITIKSASLDELTNIGFSGSNVVSGSATAIVLETGPRTEIGKIAKKLTDSPVENSFTKGIKNFSYLILRTTVFFVLFIFFFNSIIKQTDILESFMFAVAVAVGLTPELLPMIMTINMSRGSVKMAKKGVIVKRLNAIPNFGSMDILCTDKTGTLTKDKIELVQYVDLKNNNSEKVLLYAYINSLFQTGIKNPMDEAVLNYKKISNPGFEKIDEIPFDFVRKRMSVVTQNKDKRYLITKGAPEEVYKCCSHYWSDDKKYTFNREIQEVINKNYHQFSQEGSRVLAVAVKEVDKNKNIYTKNEEAEMELMGFIVFQNPAKEDVKSVLAELKTMGIEVKVITGDNELVATKICSDVGLDIKGVLLGHEIDALTDDALRVVVEKTTIFARFSPDEKNRIIHALKSNGHVVGYLGDGINDSPSLLNADIGISVNNAVDVAKESAAMVLTHKSLRVLKDGIIEGRKTFSNTMKYIMMGISSNFGNMFSVLGAMLFIPFLPMLPIQILLNNLLYDFSQITIPTDNVDSELIQKPTKWSMKFVTKFMIIFGSISSIYDFLMFFVLFGVFKATAPVFQTGWFLGSIATQTLVIYIIRTKKIPFLESMPSIYLMLSTMIIVLLAWLIPFTKFGTIFGFMHLPIQVLLILGGLVLCYLFTVELVKRFFYRKFSY